MGMTTHLDILPFDLRSLEIFIRVCETKSMSGAARLMGLTQPAVSVAIAELERKTAAQLFSRDMRPLALTPAGEILRQRAGMIIADARQLPVLLREARHRKAPTVRVGIVDSLNRALTGHLVRFLASRADEISIFSGLTATHASDLLTRKLDLFLGVDDLQDQSGLERWSIAEEPYILVLPRQCRQPRSISELGALASELPLVRFSARSQTGIQIERHLRRVGLACPRTVECDTPFAVTKLVAEGFGFAITTPLCIHEAALARTDLKPCPLPGPKLVRHLTLVARHRELGALPRDIAEFAHDALKRLPLSAKSSPPKK